MANTYSQLYVHIVFAVKGRQNLISKNKKDKIEKYITGIVTKRNQKLLAIYCMPDHTHILISLRPSISISDMVRDIKAGSSGFINEQRLMPVKFHWQEGFGAFSVSQGHVKKVIDYILNQESHHHQRSFKEEYKSILEEYEIEYQDQFLFE